MQPVIKHMALAIVACTIFSGCFEQKAKIIEDPSYGSTTHYFSWSAAIDGDYAVIGAPDSYNHYNFKTGSATVVWRGTGDWSSYPCRISPSNLDHDDFLGYSVGISGQTVILGANHEDNYAGSAFIYQWHSFGGNQNMWYQQARLIASDRASHDYFGSATAVYGNYAVIGAPHDNNNKGTDAGAVYVFMRVAGDWPQQQKLTASDGASSDHFGSAVAINGDYIVVGAPYDDNSKGTNAGAFYVFKRTGSTWNQQAKLIASDGSSGDLFGDCVSTDSLHAIAGARYNDNVNGTNAGAAYYYVRSGSSWSQKKKVIADDGAGGDYFGQSVAITDSYVVVGAPYNDNSNGTNAGAAYVFLQSSDDIAYVEKRVASDGASGDLFGYRVAVDDTYAIFGALYEDNSNGSDAGSAYIFEVQQ